MKPLRPTLGRCTVGHNIKRPRAAQTAGGMAPRGTLDAVKA